MKGRRRSHTKELRSARIQNLAEASTLQEAVNTAVAVMTTYATDTSRATRCAFRALTTPIATREGETVKTQLARMAIITHVIDNSILLIYITHVSGVVIWRESQTDKFLRV